MNKRKMPFDVKAHIFIMIQELTQKPVHIMVRIVMHFDSASRSCVVRWVLHGGAIRVSSPYMYTKASHECIVCLS